MATLALARPGHSLHKSEVLERDVDDIFVINGDNGTYYALIQAQTNADETRYGDDEGTRAWDDALNEIAQNLGTREISTETELEDDNTIIISGNTVNSLVWEDIATIDEYGILLGALSDRVIDEENPEYILISVGREEDGADFFMSFSLSWVNTA